jgi:hypothetical protein
MAWTYSSDQEKLTYTLGTVAATVGETLTGQTSNKTCVVCSAPAPTSGSFGSGNAAGVVYVKSASGVFQAEDVHGSTTFRAQCSGDLTGGFDNLNTLRMIVGDVDTSFQLFSDAELGGLITEYTSGTTVLFNKAASTALKALAVDPDRIAVLVDKLGGSMRMEAVMDQMWQRAIALAG